MSPASSSSPAVANRALKRAAAGSALLMLAGIGAFAAASQVAGKRGPDADALTVTLDGDRCSPNEISVPAGRATFQIVNRTERVVEWEILDGVMVLEERENIAPGLSQTLSARLKPGEYEITCGLLSNPRGRLVVTPGAPGNAPAAPQLVAFVAPLAEYQVFTQLQARDLVKAATALDAAIRAGDLAEARALYAKARAPYLLLAPVASRFGDLAATLDPLAPYLADREADPAFTGFHRLEYGLFAKQSLEGLGAVSAKLVADAGTLRDRLRAARPGPADLVEGPARVLRLLADATMGGGVDLYARTDLADFDASLSGATKAVMLLAPMAKDAAPQALGTVETRLAALRSQLDALHAADGYASFDTVPDDKRQALADGARSLAGAVDDLGGAIGLGEGGA